MIVPPMLPWVEERNDVAGFRIDCRKIRTLVGVATFASQSEIGRIIIPVMLPGNNVFDLKRIRDMFLRDSAILASVSRTATYQTA